VAAGEQEHAVAAVVARGWGARRGGRAGLDHLSRYQTGGLLYGKNTPTFDAKSTLLLTHPLPELHQSS
jgi:hypothetical protein